MSSFKIARLLVALFDRNINSSNRIVEDFDAKFALRWQIIIVVDVNTPILTINMNL